MPLRSRLVILLVVLVAVALVAVDFITFTSLESSLISQTDQELTRIWNAASAPGSRGVSCNDVPYGFYFNSYLANGQSIVPTLGTSCVPGIPQPIIPGSMVRGVGRNPVSVTVPTSSSAVRYRVLLEPAPSPNFQGVAVVALGVPLTSVDSTLSHQLHLLLLVSVVVLLVLALAAGALVSLSMRPLFRMARTAGEIAAGDLSARVENVDERTEVGQLGSALNAMLAQIEMAFRDKEASEEQLRRFVADASHELRTPLTSIRGYAELFRKGLADRPEDLAVAMRRIEGESVRMAGLVEDLLLLARLDQGRPLNFERVDVVHLARDAASDGMAIDAGRVISVVGPEQLVVEADEERLRQVLGNLVNNAVAHTPTGSPVEVLLELEAGGARARISVVDHGPGIPMADRAQVFERFWRADRSRGRPADGAGHRIGAGLGLSIVQAIVAAHGGTVSVGATGGGGATFVVEIPVETAPVHPSAEAQRADRLRVGLPPASNGAGGLRQGDGAPADGDPGPGDPPVGEEASLPADESS